MPPKPSTKPKKGAAPKPKPKPGPKMSRSHVAARRMTDVKVRPKVAHHAGPPLDSNVVHALHAISDPMNAPPAQMPYDCRPSIKLAREDIITLGSTMFAGVAGAQTATTGFTTNSDMVNCWVTFSNRRHGVVFNVNGKTLFQDGYSATFEGRTVVPLGAQLRVLSAAAEITYNGNVMQMGGRVSHINWVGGSSAAVRQVPLSALESTLVPTVDLGSDLHARHSRLDRDLIIPAFTTLDWDDAPEVVRNGESVAAPGLEPGTTTRWMTFNGDSPPTTSGLLIQLPYGLLVSGTVNIKLRSLVEYYHDDHAALSTTISPSADGAMLKQFATSYSLRKDVDRHGAAIEYLNAAGKMVTNFVKNHLPQHAPRFSAIYNKLASVGQKASMGFYKASQIVKGMSGLAAGL